MTFVYVVEAGMYDSRCVVGVYASPEAAMEAHPIPSHLVHFGAWVDDNRLNTPGVSWSNGLDYEDCKDITRHVLQG